MSDQSTRTKRCSKCGVTKPLESFKFSKRYSAGRYCHCKDCCNRRNNSRHALIMASRDAAMPNLFSEHFSSPEAVNSGLEWRAITGFPAYRIGNDGTVWSCYCRGGCGSRLTSVWRLINPTKNAGKYLHVCLRRLDGSIRHKVTKPVHVLVLTTFVGPRPEGMQCRHLNGNKEDNRLSNLVWGTATENIHDRTLHGTVLLGEKNHSTKLTREQVRRMRELRSQGRTILSIAKEFRVPLSTTEHVVSRRTWKWLD